MEQAARRAFSLPLKAVVFSACTLAALWLCARYSYLLFHSFAEIFSVAVACAVFMISWSSRGYPEAKPFVLLGTGYLFVALIDVFHLLSYAGMAVLPTAGDNATRLWIAARGLQAVTTFAFALLAGLRRTAPPALSFTLIGAAAAAALLSVFVWNVFPLCFVDGVGVTLFKRVSEYAISLIFIASIVLVLRSPHSMTRKERLLLSASFALTAASELVFTLYVSAYGYQNFIGHFLKIVAFALAYEALFAGKLRARFALIDELERSKARLEASQADLVRANLSKDKFFSILAHDLRNPISGLITVSELLASRFDDLGPAKARELCRMLNEGAKQSEELLECILQWARAQTGRLEVHPSLIHLAELCEGIVGLESPAAEGKGIRIAAMVDPDATAYADENMVATVLRNLLSNAVKFTPRGGKVVLSTQAEEAWQLLSVSDNGVGMSTEDQQKLFRIDVSFSCPGTESERGHGMGLILCKELVHLNRGEIIVHSERARGSTFAVKLPREVAAGQ
jgi:signal transduction histidine kinase